MAVGQRKLVGCEKGRSGIDQFDVQYEASVLLVKPLSVLPTRRALPSNPDDAIKERQGVRPPPPGFAGGTGQIGVNPTGVTSSLFQRSGRLAAPMQRFVDVASFLERRANDLGLAPGEHVAIGVCRWRVNKLVSVKGPGRVDQMTPADFPIS